MRELIDSFTSTGLKLLHHGIDHMVSCHISPTSRCNLKCEFCSVANREHHELTRGQIVQYMDTCGSLGCKAIILTGGGEPLCYPDIQWLVDWLTSSGYAIGLITNGTMCDRLPAGAWEAFDWVRVSYTGHELNLPEMKGPTLGFSVVNPTPETLRAAEQVAFTHGADYLRVVPDCRPGREQQGCVPSWSRTFIQPKEPRCPQVDVCHQAFLRPYLHESGMVYPCDSVTLHEDRQVFDEKYAWCDLNSLERMCRERRFPFKPRELCTRCVFADTVEMVDRAGKVRHVEFV